MIVGLWGKCGCGKTTVLTAAANYCMDSKKFLGINPHKRIFSNYAFSGAYHLNFEHLGKYDFSDSLILIDEIALFCDSRAWKNFDIDMQEFFATHRHQNVDIIYASQGAANMDKRVRELTHKMYIVQRAGCFSVLKPLEKHEGVQNGQGVERYYIAGFGRWTWIYRPRWYSMFDSWECKKLPPNPAEMW